LNGSLRHRLLLEALNTAKSDGEENRRSNPIR